MLEGIVASLLFIGVVVHSENALKIREDEQLPKH